MEHHPKIKNGYYYLIRAEFTTGIVVNNDNLRYLSSGDNFYIVFENIEKVLTHIKKDIKIHLNKFEYAIYDHNHEVIEVMSPPLEVLPDKKRKNIVLHFFPNWLVSKILTSDILLKKYYKHYIFYGLETIITNIKKMKKHIYRVVFFAFLFNTTQITFAQKNLSKNILGKWILFDAEIVIDEKKASKEEKENFSTIKEGFNERKSELLMDKNGKNTGYFLFENGFLLTSQQPGGEKENIQTGTWLPKDNDLIIKMHGSNEKMRGNINKEGYLTLFLGEESIKIIMFFRKAK